MREKGKVSAGCSEMEGFVFSEIKGVRGLFVLNALDGMKVNRAQLGRGVWAALRTILAPLDINFPYIIPLSSARLKCSRFQASKHTTPAAHSSGSVGSHISRFQPRVPAGPLPTLTPALGWGL